MQEAKRKKGNIKQCYLTTGGINLPNSNKNMFAAIHLGSEQAHMEIVQYDRQGNFKLLEYLVHSLSIGEETFKTGKISFTSVIQVCDLLKGFKRLINEYNVKKYLVIATTALRESQNKNYILDQIKVKTGFNVQVIDLPEEAFLKYKVLFKTLYKKNSIDPEQATLFADITSGGLGIALYQQETIHYLQNIRIGTLRIKENFNRRQRESSHFISALEEYIYSVVEKIAQVISRYEIKQLVVSGVETELILEMLQKKHLAKKGEIVILSLKDFQYLYNRVKHMNITQLTQEFNLSERKAEIVLPTIVLYKQIITLTNSLQILIPATDLVDGIVNHYVENQTMSLWLDIFNQHVVSYTRILAQKHDCATLHSKTVENFSLFLFDKLKKLHGLGKKERVLLQVSVILHDIGKFVNLRRHYFYSYHLIQSLDMLGFSNKEKDIIANTAYYHSRIVPNNNDTYYSMLDNQAKALVSKLTAIVRLADALDASHQQKISSIEVNLKENKLEVIIKSSKDISLEDWVFKEKATFFAEVFGIQALIRKKGVFHSDF